MREVLAARSGRDFTAVSAPRRRRARGRPSLGRLIVSFVLRRPGRVIGGLVFAAVAGAICVNALALQTASHPAPLFGAAERAHAPSRAAAPRPAAQPPAASAPVSITDLLAPVPPARPVNETASIPADPIGELLRSGTPEMTESGAAIEADPRLMAAQRALTKLGYGPLTEDGLFGPMTRQAIERFEREQGLAVTGLLVPQTARALSVRSGVVID